MFYNVSYIYFSVIDVTLRYDTIERDCIQVPKADVAYTDGHHDGLPSSGPARYLLEKTFEGLDIGDVSFDGSIEYTASTVDGKNCLPDYLTNGLDCEVDYGHLDISP